MDHHTRLQHLRDSAWISSGSSTLPVYSVEVAGNTVRAYVPSEAGKSFKVMFKTRCSNGPVSVRVSVDGTRVRKMRVTSDHPREHSFDGAQVDYATVRTMHFSNVEQSDDEGRTLADSALNSLGVIRIEFWDVADVVYVGHLRNATRPWDAAKLPRQNEPLSIYERQKKLGAQHLALGERVRYQLTSATHQSKLRDQTPRTVFEFFYRSVEVLRANRIMSPTDVAVIPTARADHGDHINDESDEDLEDIKPNLGRLKRKRESKAEDSPARRTIEWRRASSTASRSSQKKKRRDTSSKIKPEPAKLAGAYRTLPGGIIDLTDD